MNLSILSKLSLKQKIIASTTIFIILIVVIIYYTIVPSVKDIMNIKDDIYAQKLDLEMKYLKGQNLRSLTEKLVKAEKEMDIIDQVFVNNSDNLKFITTLENVAEENNISQKINLLKPEGAVGIFYKTPIQIFTQGTITKQLNYLVELETLNYYININSLEITSSARQSEIGQEKNVSLFISADSYWKN